MVVQDRAPDHLDQVLAGGSNQGSRETGAEVLDLDAVHAGVAAATVDDDKKDAVAGDSARRDVRTVEGQIRGSVVSGPAARGHADPEGSLYIHLADQAGVVAAVALRDLRCRCRIGQIAGGSGDEAATIRRVCLDLAPAPAAVHEVVLVAEAAVEGDARLGLFLPKGEKHCDSSCTDCFYSGFERAAGATASSLTVAMEWASGL